MQKSIKKEKCSHHLRLRDNVWMRSPVTSIWNLLLPEPHISRGKDTFHQPHSHLGPDRTTGSCMAMAKSLKPDLSYHICRTRYHHLPSVGATPRGLSVTCGASSSHCLQGLELPHPSALHKGFIKPPSPIQTTVLRLCEFLICPNDNCTF